MKRRLLWAWRWSWLVTVPCSALFLLWLSTTWQRWRKFAVEYDSRPIPVTLHDTGLESWFRMLRQARLRLQSGNLNDVPPGEQLRSVQLFVHEAELARLDDNLPYSGFEFVDALLMHDDGLHEVRMRYRGDFVVHWGFEKKSIRIRTKTDDLFAGMRQFNLIAPKFPEQLNNVLAYRLATLMGLIAPHCELVNVFLNGRNLGVHEFTEQLDEGTLRRHDRMPGDLYAGELISKDEWRGTSNLVFDLPQLWEKIAQNNHYDLESRAPLEALLRLLRQSPSEGTHAELSKLLDMSAFGRFGAFQLITQSHHFDEVHNWRLFWDPWRLKFEPVVWDPTGWTPDSRAADGVTVAADLATSRLHEWLLSNGDYLAARHRALQDFFTSGAMERFLADFDSTLVRAIHALRLDPNLRPANEAWVGAALSRLRPYVDHVLATLRAAHLGDPGRVLWARVDAGTVRLQVEGRSPVEQVVLRFERPLVALRSPPPTMLRVRHFGVPHDVDLAAGVAVQGDTLRAPVRLFGQLVSELRYRPDQALRQHGKRPAPAFYDLCVQGLPADNRLLEVKVQRGGAAVAAEPVADLPPLDVEFLYRATPPPRAAAPQVWRGDVLVEGVREVFDDVVLEPGTVVRLGPAASLLFRGRVTAAGTREQPIRFRPAAPDQDPWGTLALNSPDCTGSVFQWCDVRGGSGYKVPLEEYCSMFSIHNCERVRIEDCVFAENHQYDDMVHVMYAEVTFDRVALEGARADALDCDISTVVIRNSSIPRSGNDGIDLMTTQALIHDCRFEGNGDKGISIGEGTHLLALRNRFIGCNKAMEAKDGSIAHVANCEIRSCRKALNAYKKNWRYDSGGFLTVHKSVVVDNDALPTADRWSRALLVDCQVVGELDAEYEQEYVDGTSTRMQNVARLVDHDSRPAPQRREQLAYPEELREFERLFGEAWRSVRVDVRGVPDDR